MKCHDVDFSNNFTSVPIALLGVALLVGTSSPALAEVPVVLEGPISAVVNNGNGSGSLTTLGTIVRIPAGTPISTPTNTTLGITGLTSTAPFPGRTQNGFLGGTAKVNGTSVNGVVTATDVLVEPAESSLGGEVVQTFPLQILGTRIAPLTDPRLPALPSLNVYGFLIDTNTLPVGTPITAEGYFSNDGSGVFHSFLLTSETGTLINGTVTEVSILRAQCRAQSGNLKDMIQVLGATHHPSSGTVTISDPSPIPRFAPRTASVVMEEEASLTGPGVPEEGASSIFGSYKFQLTGFNLLDNMCPATVRVTFGSASATRPVNMN